jgi:hypothetical protein
MKKQTGDNRKWAASLTLIIAVLSVVGTNALTSPACAIDVQARQKAGAMMNLVDQSLGYYAKLLL